MANITDSLPEFHPKNVVDLEKHIGESANISISAYEKAVCALRGRTKIGKLLYVEIYMNLSFICRACRKCIYSFGLEN